MKQSKYNPKVLCYASIFALSLAACSHNPGKLKTDANLADAGAKSTDHPLKLKKGYRSKKYGLSRPDPRSYDNLWDRLFDRFELPEVARQEIDREVNWFISHPTYIERVQSRAEPFLYSIVKQLEKQNMPGELALLPVIESAFQPHAVSPAKAAGIWQFIPSTGRNYGLKTSYSYDGRRDIYASTRAAIKYLKKLHNDFSGDWLLAIAGYNCGEHAVARAIQRNAARGLPTDFWSLDLPQETRSYVPRLLAVARVFSEADQYGVSLRPIPNQALYKTVKLNSQVDLALAANAAEISLDRLFELNPGFKRQQVDLDGSYRLFIPAHKKIVDFKQELSRQVAAQGYEPVYYSSRSAVTAPAATQTDAGSSASATAESAEPPPAVAEYAPSPSPSKAESESAMADPLAVTEPPPAVAEYKPSPSKAESESALADPLAVTEAPPVVAEYKPSPRKAYRMPAPVQPVSDALPDAASTEASASAADLAAPAPAVEAAPEPVAPAKRASAVDSSDRLAGVVPGSDAYSDEIARAVNAEASPVADARPESQAFAESAAKAGQEGKDLFSNISVTDYEEVAAAANAKEQRQSAKASPKDKDKDKDKRKAQAAAQEDARAKAAERQALERQQALEQQQMRASSRAGAKNAPKGLPEVDGNAGKKAAYEVEEGDTLYSIARKHNMDVENLQKMNRLSDMDDIKYGQKLTVWSKDAAKKLPPPKTGAGIKPSPPPKYTAREGETLFSISRRFNVTVADLRKWNGIKEDKQFRAGMNITVAADKD